MSNEQKIWDFLLKEIKNEYGVAGLMGNLKAESNFIPNNLQQSYEKKLNYTDETYTAAVDNGSYTQFTSDRAGYGLAQWTSESRKVNLLEFAQAQNKSIGDLEMQLEFLVWELQNQYKPVWENLVGAETILDASNMVLLKFERPANKDSVSVQTKRAEYGKVIYDKYASSNKEPLKIEELPAALDSHTSHEVRATKYPEFKDNLFKGKYMVTGGKLNIRNGAGKNHKALVQIPSGTVVRNYGYYTRYKSENWLYVQFKYENVLYTGFALSDFLERVVE